MNWEYMGSLERGKEEISQVFKTYAYKSKLRKDRMILCFFEGGWGDKYSKNYYTHHVLLIFTGNKAFSHKYLFDSSLHSNFYVNYFIACSLHQTLIIQCTHTVQGC